MGIYYTINVFGMTSCLTTVPLECKVCPLTWQTATLYFLAPKLFDEVVWQQGRVASVSIRTVCS